MQGSNQRRFSYPVWRPWGWIVIAIPPAAGFIWAVFFPTGNLSSEFGQRLAAAFLFLAFFSAFMAQLIAGLIRPSRFIVSDDAIEGKSIMGHATVILWKNVRSIEIVPAKLTIGEHDVRIVASDGQTILTFRDDLPHSKELTAIVLERTGTKPT